MNDRSRGAPGGPALRVNVTLKGSIAERLPGGRGEVEVSDATPVGELVEILELPRSSYLFVVNGSLADRGDLLSEGDHVQIHPPMAGG